MGYWDIRSKDGNRLRARVRQLTYNGEWMGDRYVEVTIKAAAPIAFAIGDTLVYRGETYELDYIPSAEKVSSKDSYGEAFVYEGIQFKSSIRELTDTQFCDYVENDNLTHYTGLGTFSFYVQEMEDFARRIRANLDRRYGAGAWTVNVGPNADIKDQSVSISSGTSVYNALSIVNTQFKLNFIIRGRVITIGPALQTIGEDTFRYGRGRGLKAIKQTTGADNAIITRLRAYGSTRNLPYRYYNKKYNDKAKYPELFDGSGNYLLESKYMPNLMLPYACWKNRTFDAYIDADDATLGTGNGTTGKYGIKEGERIFNADDGDWHDIYPTIEDMTVAELKAADPGYAGSLTWKEAAREVSADGDGKLNRIIGGSASEDYGTSEDGTFASMEPTTEIVIPNTGFDLTTFKNESETPTLTFKSGMCSGRGMEILACSPVSQTDASKGYRLTLKRVQDTVIGMVYPNKTFEIEAGDQFVITGINLPDVYVEAAEQRLLEEAKRFLRKYDHTLYTYEPKIDNEFMARHKDISDHITEGMLFPFEDADLDVAGNIPIKHLSIKEGEELIPQYEVTLDEETVATTLEKMRAEIKDAKDTASYPTGTFVRVLSEKFIRKDMDDSTPYSLDIGKDLTVGRELTAKGIARLLKGLLLGDGSTGIDAEGRARLLSIIVQSLASPDFEPDTETGFGITKNGERYGLSISDLTVWGRALFNELEIRKLSYVGGNMVFSSCGSKITRVVPIDAEGNELVDRTEFLTTGGRLLPANGGVLTYRRKAFAKPAKAFTYRGKYMPANGKVLGRVDESVQTAAGWRCYFYQDDGTTATTNLWEAGDQARMQTSNIREGVYEGVRNRRYWRLVKAVGKDYIDLSATDCEAGSDTPQAGDTLVQFGSRTDADRMSLIYVVVNGEEAPAIIWYDKVNSYTLAGRMTSIVSPRKVYFATQQFRLVNYDGTIVPMVTDCGAWQDGKDYYYYNRVSCDGMLWLCTAPEGMAVRERPSKGSDKWLLQVDRGGEAVTVQVGVKSGSIRNGEGTVTLEAAIYRGAEDITASIPDADISWERHGANGAEDAAWNAAHTGTGKVITVTAEEAAGGADFECIYNN